MLCTWAAAASCWLAVDVDLGEHPGAGVLGREALEDRGELLAGAAPLGPEVEDDRDGHGPLEHLDLEGRLGHVDDHRTRAGPGGLGGLPRGQGSLTGGVLRGERRQVDGAVGASAERRGQGAGRAGGDSHASIVPQPSQAVSA